MAANKGEWSELYALFRLLGDGKIHAGDAFMNKISTFYPILKIIRNDIVKEYDIDATNNIVVCCEPDAPYNVSMKTFSDEADKLLGQINNPSNKGSFEIPGSQTFMNSIGCTKIKAPSANKSDIELVIHDLITNMTPLLGFSIKSQLGQPSTLLNAGKTTNFIYRIKGDIDDVLMNRINAIDDHLPRMGTIYETGLSLEYISMENENFHNNMVFINDTLPKFIAECLIEESLSSHPTLKSVVDVIANKNPFNYPRAYFYEHKMKQLLIDTALGMTPSKEWTGQYTAAGGYIVVKKTGDIVCYHFYNRNSLEDYLYNNTKFERASRSRYGFGSIYKDGNDYYLKLNLQIRFRA